MSCYFQESLWVSQTYVCQIWNPSVLSQSQLDAKSHKWTVPYRIHERCVVTGWCICTCRQPGFRWRSLHSLVSLHNLGLSTKMYWAICMKTYWFWKSVKERQSINSSCWHPHHWLFPLRITCTLLALRVPCSHSTTRQTDQVQLTQFTRVQNYVPSGNQSFQGPSVTFVIWPNYTTKECLTTDSLSSWT